MIGIKGYSKNRVRHLLYKFQDMPQDERSALVKWNSDCMNCLKAGPMASKCCAHPSCRKCCKAHHTLLCIHVSKPVEASTLETISTITHVPQPLKRKQVLLISCRAKCSVIGPDGSVLQTRMFLDPGNSCSFITK